MATRLRKIGSSNHSFLFRRMLISHCPTLASIHSFASTPKPNKSPAPDCRKWNKKITHLIRLGRLDEARRVFDTMEHRNTVTWNSMISGYVKTRDLAKARRLFDEMPVRDVVSWNLLISCYISCPGGVCIEEGRYLFDRMPERDCVSWNTMISGYARCGRMVDALRLFNIMPERNVISWNAMITGFLQNGDASSAVQLFRKMPERDSASLSALVSGLVQNGELDKAAGILLECGQKNGGQDLISAFNTLIAGYGQRGRVDDARRLFDQIPFGHEAGRGDAGRFTRNVVSWNSMIMCHVKARDLISARSLFDQMTERDSFSWNTMISGYINISNMEEASNLFHRMPNPDILTWNLMIAGFAQLGELDRAQYLFNNMPKKNLVTWNSMIAGYERKGDCRGSIRLFTHMQAAGEKPDRYTFSSLLSVCAGFVDLRLGKQFHQQLIKTIIADIPTNNSLITMYSRCGSIIEARAIFYEMKMLKDVISWNAMIGGYASHGFAAEALELFREMKRVKVQPTYITFISVLNACAHVGLVEEGRRQFRSMVFEFGIEPTVEHYASLVDIVGRDGQLEEAMDLIESMPFEPDKAVWGALLGACRVHNNLELARVAAEALVKLEPESSVPYVLLYNVYADLGQWDDATELRKKMENNNIQKQLGHSWVRLPSADYSYAPI